MGKIKTGTALLLAGLAGAGAMMFFAPAPGKKMRVLMMNRGMELRDDAIDRAEELQGTAQKMLKAQSRMLTKEAKKRAKDYRGLADDWQTIAQKNVMTMRSKLNKEAQRRMDDSRAYAREMQARKMPKRRSGLLGSIFGTNN